MLRQGRLVLPGTAATRKLAAAALLNHLVVARRDARLKELLPRLAVQQAARRRTRMDLPGCSRPLLVLPAEQSQQAAAKLGQHPLVAQLIRMPRC